MFIHIVLRAGLPLITSKTLLRRSWGHPGFKASDSAGEAEEAGGHGLDVREGCGRWGEVGGVAGDAFGDAEVVDVAK